MDSGEWRAATVPLPWQAQFDDLRLESGVGWYRRTFTLESGHDGAAILHFGAVDYHTVVFCNGMWVGNHEGGYLPFEFDVAHLLRDGENELFLRVTDPDESRRDWSKFPFSEIPHGKQSWYGPIGGVWQSVWLELRPTLHIRSLRLTSMPATASIEIRTTMSAELPADASLTAIVVGPNGERVAECSLDDSGNGQATLSAPQLWSPDAPHLYTVTVVLSVGGIAQDEARLTYGFRTVEARDGRIYLNGQPIYLRGVLDQAYYPETIYTPPSVEFLEDQARKAKALGLNCLRTHIKIEDPAYYDVADRLGLLIWTEIPNWALLTTEASRRGRETFRGMVERDGHHPSIIAWTLINENWGTDLTRNPDHRRWLAEFYHEAKAMDPTRLIIDNSACHGNSHVTSDLEDYHHYRAIPDHAQEWDEWVEDFAGRGSKWIWYSDYQHERHPDLPLIVSEFGNWGLPDPDAIQEKGKDPWWFETGYNWGEGIVYPHAMRQRFDDYQLGRVFGSFEDFIRVSQEHMAASLHYEISSMRLQPAIAGYIITEFTDVHWECNGLLTLRRDVKAGLAEVFTPINQDKVVMVRPQRWSGRPGEWIAVEVRAFGVEGQDADGVIAWQAGEASGSLPAPGGVIQAPLAGPGMVSLQVRWLDAKGAQIAANQLDLACLAPTAPPQPVAVLDDPALAATLSGLGYKVVSVDSVDLGQPGVTLIARHYSHDLERAVQQGARLLVLAGPDFAQSPESVRLPVGHILPRAGTSWQGDWATSFSWLRKEGSFAALPGGPLLEMEYAEIMPDAVLVGLPIWAMNAHSWAGLALGWIHKPVSLLASLPYGKGWITVSTFNLTAENVTNTVIAQGLVAGLIDLATRKP